MRTKNYGKIVIQALIDLIEYTLIGTAIFFFTYIFAGQLLRVTGDSMVPTFHDGEQIIAEKISVKLEDPKRGEIIIFKHPTNPGKLIIKRLIALPGETVKISQGTLYINGEKFNEPYLSPQTATTGGQIIQENTEFKVPADSYVLMGDNRNASTDSREWGPIKKDLIVGKGFIVYYPINKMRIISEQE